MKPAIPVISISCHCRHQLTRLTLRADWAYTSMGED